MSDSEEWRFVTGSDERYQVSNRGRVRRSSDGRILQASADETGRMSLQVVQNGRYVSRRVHRLVASAFLGEPPPGKTLVLHWDGNPSNNVVSNLRWGNHSENRFDSVRHGTHYATKKTHCSQGHLLVEPNLVPWFLEQYDPPRRSCLTCSRIRGRKQKRGTVSAEEIEKTYREIMRGR